VLAFCLVDKADVSKMENLYLLQAIFGILYILQLAAMYAYAFFKTINIDTYKTKRILQYLATHVPQACSTI